jgi:hypothetical protein
MPGDRELRPATGAPGFCRFQCAQSVPVRRSMPLSKHDTPCLLTVDETACRSGLPSVAAGVKGCRLCRDKMCLLSQAW